METSFTLTLNIDDDWQMQKPHFHEEYEILLSLSGNCSFFINQDVYPLRRGSLLFIADGTLHRSFSSVGELYQRYVLHCPLPTLRGFSTAQTNFAEIFGNLNCCIELDEQRLERVIWLFENCIRNDSREFGRDLRRNISFIEILLDFCELFDHHRYDIPQSTADFEKVTPILQYIDSHLGNPLTLDELSARFFLNKYYLCHIFKTATGFTIVEYITHRRILKSRTLLREGHNVQETGEMVGFTNNAHFIRTFHRLSGITPGQYAKNCRSR